MSKIKIIAILLWLAAINLSAQTYSGGSGTQADPYLISSKADMETLANTVNSGTNVYAGKYFRLTQSLTGANAISTSIGLGDFLTPNSNAFGGVFDGNGYEIVLNNNSAGVFGYISGATIQNLGVYGTVSSDIRTTAGLCAVAYNSTIAYCYNAATVSVISTNSNFNSDTHAGGICGLAGGTTITDCINTGTISISSYITNLSGGICGGLSEGSSVLNCYNTGNISTVNVGGSWGVAGGICGVANTNAQISIRNCFSANSSLEAKSNNDYYSAGRIAGDGQGSNIGLSNNYALSTMTINESSVSSSDATSINGVDASLANFKSQSWIQSNLGWDFDTVWQMSSSDSEFQGFPVLRAPAPCDNPTASGNFGENNALTWTLCPDGTLTISGQGAMSDFATIDDQPWYSYRNSIQTLNIRQGITSIGEYAFGSCSELNAIVIPNSVTSIDNWAFRSCSKLTYAFIPYSVTSINGTAFEECSGLMIIDVDSANTAYSSQDGILFNKDKTMLVSYPGGKTGSYSVPETVQTIGSGSFANCKGLTSIIIPNSVQTIEMNVFWDCSNLTTVNIGSSVTSIGWCAFNGCLDLTDVMVNWTDPSIVSIDSNAFGLFTPVNVLNVKLHIPRGTYDLYAAAPVWKDFNIVVQYAITASAGNGGSILPNGDVPVTRGDNQKFTFTPNTGYAIDQVSVDGTNNTAAVSAGSYTFDDVTSDHNILVTFKSVPTYTIFSLAGSGGSITPAGNITVTQGNSQKFIFTSNADYEISQVFIDGENNTDAVSAGSYTFENVTANHNILVTFTQISAKKYTISASAGNNGNIMPYGNVIVSQGGSQKFTFNPNTDFVIDDVLIDNVSYPSAVANGSYSFTDVTANHTISVSFKHGCLPNSVVQVWDDVLSVINNPANYNEGYTFTGYQWLKDDEEIPGETFGNLYLANDPDRTTAKYTCRVTTSNNQILYTCPLPLTLRALSAYPNPTTGKVVIEGQTLNEGDRIEVYNSTGTLVKQFSANPRQTEINLGNQPKGVYIVKVNGKQVKIIVL